MSSTLRLPAVDGRFYARDPQLLARDVRALLGSDAGPTGSHGRPVTRAAQAIVVPHAGYVYSGAIAGAVFAGTAIPERVVILGPNHTGRGVRRALWQRGAWRIPLGDVPIAEDLADALAHAAELRHDPTAHEDEHSIEVELPFLMLRRPDVRIVPICLGPLGMAESVELGRAIARVIGEHAGDVLLVASTDMSHYQSAEKARAQDEHALRRLFELDVEGLYATVVERRISMCGFVPTCVALAAARELGANRAELVRYGHSGETSGDFSRVVAYAGALVV